MLRKFYPGLLSLALLIPVGAQAADAPASFATPQAALEAFAAALSDGDGKALLEIFGADAEDLLSTGNPERDAENRAEVLDLYLGGYRFVPDGDGKIVLSLGTDDWPFPIPLVRDGGEWSFDTEEGRDEVLYRRIGLNELDVIDMLAAYVDIQATYRLVDHDGDGIMEFAASLLSTEGQKDGLYWGSDDSPLGERIALASLDGFSDGETDREAEPFGGYYYRILQLQGPQAPGGEMSYLVNGNMVAGHAMLAVPSDYGDTGIHSFIVGENGLIYEADLGPDSLEIGAALRSYDPGGEWTLLE